MAHLNQTPGFVSVEKNKAQKMLFCLNLAFEPCHAKWALKVVVDVSPLKYDELYIGTE